MRIVGTAGHVDHGKSALVRALTGTDPDRWEEERRRGMTLDLGFAKLRLADGLEAGIVDVPGHERFVHNMLAGATGMDVLLLVVAANEGPRPQTLEHLAILSLLDVPAVIVALTKADLVDAAALAAVRDDVAIAVHGSVAENAPVIAVSSLTGEGLDDLRAALQAALSGLAPRAVHAPAYLPVDRAFTLAGHGTVVTGTLMQGQIAVGDTLAVRPGDALARIRSIEVFGERAERVAAGARVAANLAGIDVGVVSRGSALVAPEIESQRSYAVRFAPLPEAVGIIRRRMPVRVHVGAGETFGTLVFATVPVESAAIDATLHLRGPVAAVPGQRFIARRMSPKTVLGGGTIGVATLQLPDTVDGPDVLAVRAAVAAFGLAAPTVEEIAARGNVRVERTADILADEAEAQRVWPLARPAAFIDAAAAEALVARVSAIARASESDAPWLLGRTSLALARDVDLAEPLLQRILAAAAERELIVARSGYYASPGHEPRLTPAQHAFFETFAPVDPQNPLVAAPFAPLVLEIRRSKIAGVSQALDTLLATGRFVRVGEHLYRGEQMAEIRARLERVLRAQKRMTAAQFRDATGLTRKYVVPLLEYFDSAGVTVRDGDVRALRGVSPQP